MHPSPLLTLLLLLVPLASARRADHLSSYTPGAEIQIQCLNRTLDGEHVVDEHTKRLQYLPFYACNETGLPLALPFRRSLALPCTVPSISDTLYHHLEYYVHHDTPLSCRLASRPPPRDEEIPADEDGDDAVEYTPVTLALAGKLELSHLHVQTEVNVLMHWEAGGVKSGVGYSRSGEGRRVIIGDPLPLVFHVLWTEGEELGGVGETAAADGGAGVGQLLVVGLVGVAVGVAAVTVGRGEVVRRVLRRVRGRGAGGIIGTDAPRRGYGGYGLPSHHVGNGNGAGGYGYVGVKRKD